NLAEDAPEPIGTLPVRASFTGLAAFEGRTMEVHLRRVHEGGVMETVYVYRLAAIRDDSLTRFEDALVELRQHYQVAIWIDTNGNGTYDPPSALGLEGRDYATTIEAVGEPPGDEGDPDGVQIIFDDASLPPPADIAREP